MYKLLIVDDEKEIRNGLSSWPWEQLGIQLAGSCAHGLEALQVIAETPVDIVMTDIRMPFMTGIELMEAISRAYPFIHVMILSGYSDFEYAKKAIRHDAADYLLKPIQPAAMQEAFQALVARLDERRQSEHRLSMLQRKERMLSSVLRERFLRRLFRHSMPEEELEQGSSEGELLLDGSTYTVAAFRFDRFKDDPAPAISEKELRLIAFSLDNILQDIWDSRGSGYHLVDRDAASFMLLSTAPTAQEDFEAVPDQLERYTGLFKSTVSVGIGRTVDQARDIHFSAHSAAEALRDAAEDAAMATFKVNKERDSALLTVAREFIQQHYHRSLTLKETAEHVYLSQGHLSALFKESGDTYLKYLTSIRMQKAMELLGDPALKIYEIVERVGYADPAYFSGLFKKHTGLTPHDYRNR
jgi:two-component system response regulator YesN